MAHPRPAARPDRAPPATGVEGPGPAPRGLPAAGEITTARLVLEPLVPEHAGPMLTVLGDPALYLFTGGEPPTADGLRRRYALQSAGGSPDGRQAWFNWILRVRGEGGPAGFVQATVQAADPEAADPEASADLAWLVGVPHQGRGLASEAALGVRDWLAARGVARFAARIHPRHTASARVARRLGLRPAPAPDADGEVRWSSGG